MDDPAPGDVLPPSVHASCVAIGGDGVLIRGASGAGKSTLALGLILDAPRVLPPAELVADDRVHLTVEGGALIARPSPRLAGLIEVRGLGIRRLEYRSFVAVRLLVDLSASAPPRMPPADVGREEVQGIVIKRISAVGPALARLLVAAVLATDDYEN